eukprot:EG_transcript_10177
MNGMTWQVYLQEGPGPAQPKRKKPKRRREAVPVEVVTHVEPKPKRPKPPAVAAHGLPPPLPPVAVASPAPGAVAQPPPGPAPPQAPGRRGLADKRPGAAVPAVGRTQGRPKYPLPCGAPCSWSDFWHPLPDASPGEASLTEGIERFCARRHFGCPREAQRRSDFAQRVEALLQKVLPTSSIHLSGSTLNTLFVRDSDVDLICVCSCSPHFECVHGSVLFTTGRRVLSSSLRTHVKHIPARCPILQCTTRTQGCAFAFDISFGSLSGVHGNGFLRDHYLHTNPYALPLTAAVKRWAINRGVLNSPNHYLPSHAIVLLVVAFLQRQGMLPRATYAEPSPSPTELPAGLPGVPPSNPSLGALFVAFFEEMASFPFHTTVIGVRAETITQRAANPAFGRCQDPWVVEDPASPSLNVTRNLTPRTAAEIRQAFAEAAQAVRQWERLPAPPGPLDLDRFGLRLPPMALAHRKT